MLAPYLMGQTQMAYHNLDPREALEYPRVKAAILEQTGISPETYRQHLHKEQYPPGARPRAVAQWVQDLCWRWLEPEGLTGPQVGEMVVLEQFTQILPAGVKAWVQRHQPATLSGAVGLMEDYLAAEEAEALPRRSGNLSKRDRPVKRSPQGEEALESLSNTRPTPTKPPSPKPRHRVTRTRIQREWPHEGGGAHQGKALALGRPGPLREVRTTGTFSAGMPLHGLQLWASIGCWTQSLEKGARKISNPCVG
ncbi:zinc finger and SCAN domain-containing protein 16-like [Gopherus evgoodei]|uniref:zinc finger and SCAN domain-containing protein 16-like n=1 Tax=Gopherus evgoodei TaxID=1825980 RepID=UPI0011CF3816|nr:zinc finger and SCAN domain-containing protein 16-like [Gopherus evgoodei]